jgi:hypothetical protein
MSASLHDMVMQLKERLGFNNSELLTLAGQIFIQNPFVSAKYSDFVQELTSKHNCTSAELEQAIYDSARLKARERRYALSQEKGEFVDDTKIAT